jgi:REP element-mobilizing transposase RayT
MSRKFKIRNQGYPHFVTLTVVGWVDLFTKNEFIEIVKESLLYCRKHKGLLIYAYCIMPSHVHLILGSKNINLSDIIRDFKRYTSSKIRIELFGKCLYESRRNWLISIFQNQGINNSNNYGWQLWMQHNHPIELYNDKLLHQKINYIHFNPVEAGYVEKPEYWLWSSARNFCSMQAKIETDEGLF